MNRASEPSHQAFHSNTAAGPNDTVNGDVRSTTYQPLFAESLWNIGPCTVFSASPTLNYKEPISFPLAEKSKPHMNTAEEEDGGELQKVNSNSCTPTGCEKVKQYIGRLLFFFLSCERWTNPPPPGRLDCLKYLSGPGSPPQSSASCFIYSCALKLSAVVSRAAGPLVVTCSAPAWRRHLYSARRQPELFTKAVFEATT